MFAGVLLFLFPYLIILFFWKYRREFKLLYSIPCYPGAIPFLGHNYLFVGSRARLLNQLTKIIKYAIANGGVVRFKTHHWMKPHFIITDPKDASFILNNCLKKAYIYNIIKPLLGEGLVTAQLSIWHQRRRLLNPAFNPQILNSFIPTFEKHAKQLVARLADFEDGEQFDPSRCIMYCTFETILETAIGVTSKIEDYEKLLFFENYQSLADMFVNPIVNVLSYFQCVTKNTSLLRKRDRLIEEMNRFVTDITSRRKLEFQNDEKDLETKFKPFLQLILKLSETKGVFNEKEINEEVMNMILAGYETTALVLKYLFVAVGSYPHIQMKVYDELKGILGNDERDITREDLSKMIYLEAVINETLRLYPIGFIIGRDLEYDVQLTNHTLPAGSSCFISVWGLHTGQQWGPDALEFNPDRWLDPSKLPDVSCFSGFSIGKRMCIGKVFAMYSMKTILAHVFRKYIIRADIKKLELKLDMLLKPLMGHEISVEKRK